MKQIIILLSILSLQATASKLHAQNWGQWVSVSYQNDVQMYVSFKVNGTECTMANGHFRVDNKSYYGKGSVLVAFKYYDCDGNLTDYTQTINLSSTGIDEDGGYWFSTSSGQIKDVRFDEVYIPEKKIWLKRINGQTVDIWKQKYGR
jgi:hypothetical protein